jgi:thiol:disulfide interchange protein DsbA
MAMKHWMRGLLVALALSPLACSAEAPANFSEGKEYAKVREAVPAADSKKVTVEEFFWYGCPHCYHADPAIESWKAKKAADVDFQRVPNTLGNPVGELHMRAFYIAEALGVSDKIHKPFFDAIHEKHLQLNTLESVKSFFVAEAGIKPDDFDKATSSFLVDSRMRRAQQLSMSYGITSVPTLVVGGKYTTSATMAGSPEKAMVVVDFLVDKIRKERK